jgi:hypothetical protein
MRRAGTAVAGFVAAILALVSVAPNPPARAGAPAASPSFGDDRFGITLKGDPQQLLTLGVRYFTHDDWGLSAIPPGTTWVQYVSFVAKPPSRDALEEHVAAWPGSYWLMSNEPNATGSDEVETPADYARDLHDTVALIKGVDPSAQIVGPNVINFDFTCINCPGYTSGHEWMDAFLDAYRSAYGSAPPIDVWAIHTYPLDWDNVPQVDTPLVEDQLVEFRQYLDARPAMAGMPIWDTEVGTEWGFDGIVWLPDTSGATKAFPIGSYDADKLLAFMTDFLSWLATNGPSMRIDRWFMYCSYSGPQPFATVYGGINLFDGDLAGARLTTFGQRYRQLAGLSP